MPDSFGRGSAVRAGLRGDELARALPQFAVANGMRNRPSLNQDAGTLRAWSAASEADVSAIPTIPAAWRSGEASRRAANPHFSRRYRRLHLARKTDAG